MYFIKAHLVNVITDGDFPSLVFKSSRFDYGLQCDVPCSLKVLIDKAHLLHAPDYRSFINSDIMIPVHVRVMKSGNGLFHVTSGDGLPLAS